MASDEAIIQQGMEKYCFYEKELKIGDIVMVQVVRMDDNSVIVRLLEYQNREAMLPHTELTTVRIRSVKQTISIGQVQPMEILRFDPKQGYVDVSKKKVKAQDRAACEDRYEGAKQVQRILLRTATLTGVAFEDLQKAIAFPAYAKFNHAIILFKNAAVEPSVLDEFVTNFDPKVKEVLVGLIQHSLKLKEVIVQAKVNATCYSRAGVDGLRNALLKTQDFGESVAPKMKLLVHLSACPEYLLHVKTDDKVAGRKKLSDAIEVLRKELAAVGGEVTVKEEPSVIEGKSDKKAAVGAAAAAAAAEDDTA